MYFTLILIKFLNKFKKHLEVLRRRISRKTFFTSNSTFKEAVYIDLNWLNFETEYDKKFIKFFYKLQSFCLNNPNSLDNFLF